MLSERLPRFPLFALLVAFAALFAVPLFRAGLPGYDDALYAHIAKDAWRSGDYLHLKSNGYPALEHPPLLPWMEAAIFELTGPTDAAARFPSAVCGFCTLLLVWWLARRESEGDDTTALFAMFAMGTSLYFVKYASHAMTDVPFAFFFLCAICCWRKSEDHAGWLLAAGFFTAATQMTRGLAGLALPVVFVADALLARRRVNVLYAGAGLGIAFAPPLTWSWFLYHSYGDFYVAVHQQFLERDITVPSPLRSLIFVWMLAKSYWPWLPAAVAGLWMTRNRFLLSWITAALAACSVIKNPVLRYLLPAFPALATASGFALRRYMPGRTVWCLPGVALVFALVAALQPNHENAAEIRTLALLATKATAEGERIGFYDAGSPRFDETNQLQWYGQRVFTILESPAILEANLKGAPARTWITDRATQAQRFPGAKLVGAAGHLVCFQNYQK